MSLKKIRAAYLEGNINVFPEYDARVAEFWIFLWQTSWKISKNTTSCPSHPHQHHHTQIQAFIYHTTCLLAVSLFSQSSFEVSTFFYVAAEFFSLHIFMTKKLACLRLTERNVTLLHKKMLHLEFPFMWWLGWNEEELHECEILF